MSFEILREAWLSNWENFDRTSDYEYQIRAREERDNFERRDQSNITIIEQIESRSSALKAAEVAKLLEVTRQHLYAMAAEGAIPCFRVGAAIRFDPHELAAWLKKRRPKTVRNGKNCAAA